MADWILVHYCARVLGSLADCFGRLVDYWIVLVDWIGRLDSYPIVIQKRGLLDWMMVLWITLFCGMAWQIVLVDWCGGLVWFGRLV